MGADGVGELFDQVVDLAAGAWGLLENDARFEVVVRPQLSTLVFRYVGEGVRGGVSAEVCDRANLYAREAIAASGDAMVAATVVDGRHFLKFTLLNPRTTLGDIAAVLDLLAGYAERYMAGAVDAVDVCCAHEPAFAHAG
jgi:L-2,4-diaminobutyrate decarboxylase